ncbi:hypothetical protein SUGI_0899380 [Cryptomeria japonica]|nr:hypothetical protein SUGI_0899380 [Cryptomeria japonica]
MEKTKTSRSFSLSLQLFTGTATTQQQNHLITISQLLGRTGNLPEQESLLILCHSGEDFSSQLRRSCNLLLDFFREAEPKQSEPSTSYVWFHFLKNWKDSSFGSSISVTPFIIQKGTTVCNPGDEENFNKSKKLHVFFIIAKLV